MRFKKQRFSLLLLLSFAFIALALYASQIQEKRTVEPVVLKIPLKDKIESLNPYQSVRTDLNRVFYQVFDCLVSVNSGGYIVPSLAKSWKINREEKYIELSLNDDIYFSDGSKLDTNHVIISLKASVQSKNLLSTQVRKVTAISRRSVRIFLKNQNFSLLFRKLASNEGFISKKVGDDWIGTGPYIVTKHKPRHIVLKRYKNLREGYFKAIEFVLVDRNEMEQMFSEGKIDELNSSTPPKVSGNFKEFNFPGTLILALNAKTEAFIKVKDRRFLLKNLNRSTILNAVKKTGTIATSLIPKGMSGYKSKTYPKQTNEIGKIDGSSIGKKKTLRVGVVESFLEENGKDLIRKEFFRLGYNVVFISDSFLNLLKLFRERQIDLTFKIDSGHFFDPVFMFDPYLDQSANNIHGSKDDRLENLFRKYESSMDSHTKLGILEELENRLDELAYVVPIAYPKQYVTFSSKVNLSKIKDISLSFWKFNYRDFKYN